MLESVCTDKMRQSAEHAANSRLDAAKKAPYLSATTDAD
jgi:hypothetical protein